jgi:hypothetical protein
MNSEKFVQSPHEGAEAFATAVQTKAIEVTYPNGYKALHSTTLTDDIQQNSCHKSYSRRSACSP